MRSDSAATGAPTSRPSAPGRAPFAVVELFTSEGCSSCPPADEALARLVDDSRRSGVPVYPLAFHVDYWNDLGWSDPYSSAAFSECQRTYASRGGARQVYTPQMIVNGKGGFVGSDSAEAAKQIRQALERPAAVPVSLGIARLQGDKLQVSYGFDNNPLPANATLVVTVAERGVTTAVKAGENGGRSLRHENVVRAYATVASPIAAGGTVELTLPAGLKRENASVVGFVQDTKSLEILGANAIDLGK